MILRSLTCFKYASLLLALAQAPITFASNVGGKVVLIDSRDPEVRKHADFSGVVVWLKPSLESGQTIASRHVRMIQKDKRFDPHILAIRSGTTVDFPNFDPVFHNAFSNFNGQLFDIGLYPPGSSRSIRFTHAGIVRVFCNIHPTMSAVIVVLDTPYFASSGRSGQFAIADVPAGEYEMHVMDERSAPETLSKLVRTITVSTTDLTLPTMSISEAGYLPLPHKNKYGHDYPPTSSDQNGYSLTPQ